MQLRPSHLHPRRWPLGSLGMVALLACIECHLGNRSLDFMGDSAFGWAWGARNASQAAAGRQILCFGDSLVKFGVVPRVVEGRVGLTAFNLAVSGGRPANSYFLLQHTFAAGARPAAIVVDAELINSSPFEMPYLWPHLATPPQAAGLAWQGGDAGFLGQYALAWLLPSVRCRYEIRSVLREAAGNLGSGRRGLGRAGRFLYRAFCGRGTQYRETATVSTRNWGANLGALVLPASRQLAADSVVGIDAYPVDASVPGRWAVEPANAAYLGRFFDLAESRGIPVFWVIPPQYRMLERYFERPNWRGLQRDFIRQQLDRHPNVVVVDGSRADYDRSEVADVSHLNRRGAVAFSADLGDIIRNRLAAGLAAGPRWLDLPHFVAQPAEVFVEDLAQSFDEVKRRK